MRRCFATNHVQSLLITCFELLLKRPCSISSHCSCCHFGCPFWLAFVLQILHDQCHIVRCSLSRTYWHASVSLSLRWSMVCASFYVFQFFTRYLRDAICNRCPTIVVCHTRNNLPVAIHTLTRIQRRCNKKIYQASACETFAQFVTAIKCILFRRHNMLLTSNMMTPKIVTSNTHTLQTNMITGQRSHRNVDGMLWSSDDMLSAINPQLAGSGHV